MKSTKKMLCFVLAIAVMVGSMGLVSSFANNTGDTGATTVGLTGDPEYVLKFTQDVVNSSKLLTLNDMRSADYFNESDALTDEFVKSNAKSGMKVDLNSNNSITMTKSSVTDGSDYQYSTILEVPVTDEMKANYLKATDKKLYISYWLSDCQKTNASGVANGVYTGAAYEGIGLLPYFGTKIDFILQPLFGFTSAECIAVPITALGSAGAAIGLIPGMVSTGMATGNDIAVFTAMCMCYSGYLSTHVAMMSVLKFPELTGKSILAHTIGGLCAGISAHWIYLLLL